LTSSASGEFLMECNIFLYANPPRDTVSSVGLIPRTLPHSNHNDGVKVFRHALALDECRARFRPSVWGEPLSVREEMDYDPLIEQPPGDVEERNGWVYEPPPITNIKEVWFAGELNVDRVLLFTNKTRIWVGCHADVGGGSHKDDETSTSLSNIALRWMIKECYLLKKGLLFDRDALFELGLNITDLENRPEEVDVGKPYTGPAPTSQVGGDADQTQAPGSAMGTKDSFLFPKDKVDAAANLYDQLLLNWAWWLLEAFPMITTRQIEEGVWLRERR
jgi:hypothetical protein